MLIRKSGMIIHILKITGPIDVDSFPPSVASSGWIDQLSVGAKSNGSFEISSNTETLYELKTVIVWNSEEEMTKLVEDDAVSTIKSKNCEEWARQFSYENMVKRYEELAQKAVETGGW
jgi:hypothetical protein